MTFARTNTKHRTDSYIGTVNNDRKGRFTLHEIRRLFRPFGTVATMGRNPNRKKLALKVGRQRGYTIDEIYRLHQDLRQSVPIRWSTRLDMYLRPRQMRMY